MGTRSILTFIEGDTVLLSIYRQYDGYLEGRGKELAEFMAGFKVVNGYGMGDVGGTTANGMGCLAAQWLMHEKANFFEGQINFNKPKEGGGFEQDDWSPEDALGNVYVQAPQEWPDKEDWTEYFYRVEMVEVPTEEGTSTRTKLVLSVCDMDNPGEYLFRGSPEDMLGFIEHYYDEENDEVNKDNPFSYKG
jgi:hypothetical protein